MFDHHHTHSHTLFKITDFSNLVFMCDKDFASFTNQPSSPLSASLILYGFFTPRWLDLLTNYILWPLETWQKVGTV